MKYGGKLRITFKLSGQGKDEMVTICDRFANLKHSSELRHDWKTSVLKKFKASRPICNNKPSNFLHIIPCERIPILSYKGSHIPFLYKIIDKPLV